MPPVAAEAIDISTLADALRGPLIRASRRLRREAQKVGLSAHDAILLGHIQRHPGCGVSELADFDEISRPTMSSHVKRLETQGWIRRADDAEDGRRSGLFLTPPGARKLETLRRLRNDWLATRLARLNPDEQHALAAAAAPLRKLVSIDP
jgi:DNA-binding MarR family transcriptional regulator